MKYIFLFCILYWTSAKVVANETVEIYYDTLGDVYINYEQGFINKITNPQQYHLSEGYGKVIFDINNHDVTLMSYLPLRHSSLRALSQSYSPMFINIIYIGIFRGANKNDPTRCTPIAKAREYVKYVELSMRLWSGNQVRIAQGDGLYISSQCLVIDKSIYDSGKTGEINNALYAEAEKTDVIPKLAVKWFINDDYPGSWLGLAAVGSPSIVSNRNSNYWLICKYNPSPEDPNNGKITTLTHEFGHNCGFQHAGAKSQSESGTFTIFSAVDSYDDGANIMGAYAGWTRPILASQYWQVVVGANPEPWLFKYPEEGLHKYRIYAIDHPYTRHFLGTNEPFHDDFEMFDGIRFKYNCLAIRVLVNKGLTSKYTGADGSSGSIMLEYRRNPNGLQSAQEFGIRVTYGFSQYSNLLMANMDHLQSWGDSEIIPGVDYYPVDFDVGTLRIRVTKIHKVVLKESLEKEILKEDKRNYDEPSYAELEIEYYPNKKPPTSSPPTGLPSFIFSPSFHNCKNNDDGNGITCSLSSTKSGWYYFMDDGKRDRNIPRIYLSNNNFFKGRKSLRSYNGWEFTNTKICYGDEGIKCITITINTVNYANINRRNYQYASVTRKKLNDGSAKDEDLGIVNLIFGSNFVLPEGGRAYVTDLFGNEKEIKVVDKVFVELLPSLETDGFAEGAVVAKDKDGKVTYYSGFTLYHQENGNRVAFGYNDENNEIELSPAVMPNGKYTTTTMLYSVLIKADDWLIYPIQRLDYNDYILIDLKGIVPFGLIMTAETDLGEYIRDLSDLGGLTDVSYKLTFKEMNRATGGWGEVDRIKFNKDIEIQNIRPIYVSKVGNQMSNVNARTENFNYDGYRYTVRQPKSESNYIYNKVKVVINGTEYSFDTSTTVIKITKPTTSPPTRNPSDSNLLNENSEWEYSDDSQYDNSWNSYYRSDIDNWKKSSPNHFEPKNVISRYYRRTFQIESDLSLVGSPKLEMNISEGIIIYINGFEIYRYNLEGIKIDSNTRAIKSYDIAKKKLINIPLSVIYGGLNFIGIEIHENKQLVNKVDSFNLKLGISDVLPGVELMSGKDDVNIKYYAKTAGLIPGNAYGIKDDYDNITTTNKFRYDKIESEVLPWSTTISLKNDEARYVNLFQFAGCTNNAATHPNSIIVYGSTDKENSTWDELYRNEDLEFTYHTDDASINSCSDQLTVLIPTYKSYEILKVTILKTREYNNWIQFRLLTFSQCRLNICKKNGEFPSAFGNSIVKVSCSEIGYKSRKCKEDGNWDNNIDESRCNIYPTTIRPTTPTPTTVKPTTQIPTTVKPTTIKPTTPIPTTIEPTTPNPTTPIPTTQPPTTQPTTPNPSTLSPTTPTTPTTPNPTTINPTSTESTTLQPTTVVPTTPNPIEKIGIEIKVSNITDNLTLTLTEFDKIMIKDSIVEIYNNEGIILKREDIEVKNNNQNILLRGLGNEMNIEVIITIPEESTKDEIKKIAEKLLYSKTLHEIIQSKCEISGKTTIFNNADIEVIRVEDKTIKPTDSNDKDGDNSGGLSTVVLIGIIAGGVVIVIVILIGFMLCRCRKTESHSSKKPKAKSKKNKPVAEKGVKVNEKKANDEKPKEEEEKKVEVKSNQPPPPPTRSDRKPTPPPPPKRKEEKTSIKDKTEVKEHHTSVDV